MISAKLYPLLLLAAALLSVPANASSTKPSSSSLRALQMGPSPMEDGWQLPAWAQDLVDTNLFGDIDWESPTAWQDWMDNLMAQTNAAMENVDVCPLLEMAVGMGQAFGIAAECTCEGDLAASLQIGCSFQQCLPPVTDMIDAVTATERQQSPQAGVNDNTAICGNVSLNFTFGGKGESPGSIATSVCADFPDGLFQDTCFSYNMSVVNTGDNNNAIKQSCTASYGGEPCECTIDDGMCLNLNCSAVLPGAAMDTCQWLQMDTERDFSSWMPQWDVFDSNFTLDADMIPWQNLDWDHLDWLNFNVTAIEWSSPEWLTEGWTNLVGNISEGVSEGICTFLETAVQLTEELGAKGSCKCGTTVSEGLVVDCDFAEICLDNSVGSVGPEPLCAAVNMTLNYDTLAGVENEVCMDFFGDTHPTTCFSYTIPFANPDLPPTCSATYGGDTCECTIDENFCILVDCSEFEASAVMDTCQFVGVGGAVEAQQFMLPFKVPVEKQPIEEGVDTVAEPSGESDGSPTSSELASSAPSITAQARMAATVSFLILLNWFA